MVKQLFHLLHFINCNSNCMDNVLISVSFALDVLSLYSICMDGKLLTGWTETDLPDKCLQLSKLFVFYQTSY